MIRNLLVLLVFALAAVFPAHAQQRDQHAADVSIRGSVGIPKSISSRAFRASFSGVYEANVSFNLRLFDNFNAGAGYQNALFRSNSKLQATVLNVLLPYNIRLESHGGYLKLGYDQFFSKIGYMSYALNAGLVNYRYRDFTPDTSDANKPAGPLSISAPYIQPEVSVCFIVEKSISFSLFMAYNTLLGNYNPKSPRLNHFPEVSSASNRHYISWLTFGFGFQALFTKK